MALMKGQKNLPEEEAFDAYEWALKARRLTQSDLSWNAHRAAGPGLPHVWSIGGQIEPASNVIEMRRA